MRVPVVDVPPPNLIPVLIYYVICNHPRFLQLEVVFFDPFSLSLTTSARTTYSGAANRLKVEDISNRF